MEESIYYIHTGGQQHGPFPLSQLPYQGVTTETMVWRPGLPNWVPASHLPEVMAVLQENSYGPRFNPREAPLGQPPYVTPQEPNPYGQYGPYGQPNPYAQNPYGQPQYGFFPAGWTNWLPWAIVATVVAVVFCGLLNTVFGIIGIVRANSANDAARRGDPAASQINQSAKTWTIVSFALSGLALIIASIAFFSNLF